MKRTRTLVGRGAVLLLAGILAACSDTTAPAPAGPDPLVEQLVAMGVSRDQIVDRGDHFVVEGDIRFNKKDLRAAASRPGDGLARPGEPSLQRYAGTVAENRRIVKVNLSAIDTESASWAAAVRAAMANWSAVTNSYVRFVEGSPADIVITFVNSLGSCTVGQGSFPVAGVPGATVQISRAYASSYTYAKQVWIMTHELGHNIGFAHTDQSSFGTRVPGTPSSSDGGSVMNSGATYGGCPPAAPDWSSFSSYDDMAMQYMHPIPAPTGMVGTHPSGTVVLSWNAMYDAGYYQIQRVEVYRSEDYERGSEVFVYPSGWVNVYGTSIDTESTWTGTSYCQWYDSMYSSQYSEYFYEVRAVTSTGASKYVAWVNAEDATC